MGISVAQARLFRGILEIPVTLTARVQPGSARGAGSTL
jgi:hypothetical protein